MLFSSNSKAGVLKIFRTCRRRLHQRRWGVAFALTTLFLLGQSAATQAQPFAYVANSSFDNVSVINTASNTWTSPA